MMTMNHLPWCIGEWITSLMNLAIHLLAYLTKTLIEINVEMILIKTLFKIGLIVEQIQDQSRILNLITRMIQEGMMTLILISLVDQFRF